MMNFLFRDPLRGVGFLNLDVFPYRKGDDEIEIDFIAKSAVYLALLVGGGLLFVEGGWLIYSSWVLINFLRRNQK